MKVSEKVVWMIKFHHCHFSAIFGADPFREVFRRTSHELLWDTLREALCLQFALLPRYKNLRGRALPLTLFIHPYAPANPLFALHRSGHHLRVVP